MRLFPFFIFLFFLMPFCHADAITRVTDAVSGLCGELMGLLPVVSMLLVLVGSVVYASGQLMGAETRARANVWATACLTGAIMGMLITAIAPPVLSAIYDEEVSCTAAGGASPPTPNPPPRPPPRPPIEIN